MSVVYCKIAETMQNRCTIPSRLKRCLRCQLIKRVYIFFRKLNLNWRITFAVVDAKRCAHYRRKSRRSADYSDNYQARLKRINSVFIFILKSQGRKRPAPYRSKKSHPTALCSRIHELIPANQVRS